MNANDLLALLRAGPFIPFRLHTSGGKTYDIKHPDQALVAKSRVILPQPGEGDPPDRFDHLALLHIVRAEELPVGASAQDNGHSQ